MKKVKGYVKLFGCSERINFEFEFPDGATPGEIADREQEEIRKAIDRYSETENEN